jgi:PASTA domain-containing protein/List-Bact-rpt repeat protein/FG-GAP repeat protein
MSMLVRARLSRAAIAAVVVVAGGLVSGAGPSEARPATAPQQPAPAGLLQAIRSQVAAPASATSTPTASLSGTNGSAGGFGLSVAFSADGTTAIVGAPNEDGGTGAAYIFHSTPEGGWSSSGLPATRLTDGNQGSRDDFGKSVAISADGKTVLVGAPGVGGDVGAVYVFNASDESSWSTPNKLASLADGANPSDGLGFSVALSSDGTTALIGAYPENDNTINATGAYVFHVASETAWSSSTTPAATLSDGSATSDLFGDAVSLSADGTTGLVGAYLGGNDQTGRSYVFHASGEGSWALATSPVATLSNSGAPLLADFGWAVALSADGQTATVGEPSGSSASEGQVDVFHASAESAWTSASSPTAVLTKTNGQVDDRLGLSVAIAGDGTTILVGGSWESLADFDGAALLFHVASAGSWVSSSSPTATLTNAAAAGAGQQLGDAVGLSSDGTVAVAGAPNALATGGALDVFSSPSESSWTSTSAPDATLESDAPINTGVGVSSALSADGTTALVGATAVDQRHGGALLFHVSSPASWTTSSSPTASLMVPGPTSSVGVALSADGTTAFVAAPSSGAAAVYIFRASSEGSWNSSPAPVATLSIGSQPCNDASIAASTDGTTIMVGCPSGTNVAGAAYVFHVAAESAWTTTSAPSATLTDGDTTQDDFGTSVALSADGTTAVIGAPGAHSRLGAAYVFHAPDASNWASASAPKATLPDLDSSFQDLAGESVAISPDGTTALVGAPFARNTAGVAYVFDVPSAAAWGTTTPSSGELADSAGSNGDNFGTSLALSSNGTSAFVGTPSGGGRSGVYLFEASSEHDWATQSLSSPTLTGGGGRSVALSGDRGIALAGDGFPESGGGHAWIFDLPAEPDTLSVSRAGSGAGAVTSAPGGIACGSTCSHDFAYGTLVTLTATPSAGSTFAGWSGACAGSSSTCNIRMSQAQSATATFATIATPSHLLTVTKVGSGHGTVTSTPAGISCGTTCSHAYSQGTAVSLTAQPAAGSAFAGWTGLCTGTGSCSLSTNTDTTITATFKLIPKKCVVPKVKGKTLRAAKRSIRNHACTVGKIKHVASRTVKKGHVISQKPKPGRRLKHGAKVNLVVSRGRQ